MFEQKSFTFDVKELTEEGTFEGYASTFGNVDQGGDIVEKGAFRKTIKENPNPPILWQHDSYEPIGVTEQMKEDERGLWVKGRLVLDVPRAQQALSLMKAGALSGLSIGYRAVKWLIDEKEMVRRLKELYLREWSPVTFPMNLSARVTAAKALNPERWTQERLEELAKQAQTLVTTPDSDVVGGEPIHALASDVLELLTELREGKSAQDTLPCLLDDVVSLCARASTLRVKGDYGPKINQAIDLLAGLPDTVYGEQRDMAMEAVKSLLPLAEKPEPSTSPNGEPSPVEATLRGLFDDLKSIRGGR